MGSDRRLKIIYNSNKRSARASATWERAQRTKDFAPYFQYRLGPSAKHRENHVKWEDKILLIDDVFWDHAYPPNGWGCRCYVVQLTKNQAEQRGGVSKRPIMEFSTKQVNDKEVKYMQGVDPAWSSNSGKFRSKVLSDTLVTKLLKQNEATATNMIQNIVQSNFFKRFFNNSQKIQEEVKALKDRKYNYIPVAYVNKGITKDPNILQLSEETLAVKKETHADIKLEDYSLIQDIVLNGIYNKDRKAYAKKIGNNNYLVVVKLTK